MTLTPEQIEKYNTMIAEFMGTYNACDSYGKDCKFLNGLPLRVKFIHSKKINFKYHISFDWLMPVYNKIMKLNNRENLYKKTSEVVEALIYGEIEPIYLSIANFIEWWGSNK